MNAAPPPSLPSIIRFLLPSVRDIFFVLLFASILVGPLANRPLADADIGWHIRTGQLILQTHAIPHTDPFSTSMQGRTWFAWEWLYDVGLGILYRLGGLNAVVWLPAVLVALTITLLLRFLLNDGTGLPLSIVLALLVLGAALIHLYARPHIVSWLFSLNWLAALRYWEKAPWEQGRTPRWLPWFFPVSMLAWVNLHGGWLFGMALLAGFALAAWIERMQTKDGFAAIAVAKRARAMCRALGWSALATLMNPYGWRLHAHIYQYLGSSYLMNRIQEFRSPDFHGWAERCFGTLVVLLLVGFAVRRGTVRLSDFLIALLAVYAGFYSSRNLPVSSMLLALIAGPILWEKFCSLTDRPGAWSILQNFTSRVTSFADRMAAQEGQLRGHLWPVGVVVVAAAICLHGGWLGAHHLIHAHFDESRLPVAAAAFLDRRGDSGPVFSTDSWGGYLIYRWYPARRVLVDDRHDFYGTDYVREYLIMMQDEMAWRSVLEKWKIRTALLPAGAPLANLLRELPQQWRVIYEDNVAVVFEKNPEPKATP